MDNSPEDAPLARGSLAGSEEVLVIPAAPATTGTSNRSALKIAGLTTLACLLLSSQVFAVFMVINQKQQIHTLQTNSMKFSSQLSVSSKGQSGSPMKMQMPINSIPLLNDFSPDSPPEKSRTPLVKLQKAIVNVEKQVKDLLKESELPQFNETFMANLKGMKGHMNESEWKSFESWMRFWLIFQMAQEKPVPPTPQTAPEIKTKCQLESSSKVSRFGGYRPQCDEQGRFRSMQCWSATGFCWCVDESGATIEGTPMRGRPDCRTGAASRRAMAAPLLMQRTMDLADQ